MFNPDDFVGMIIGVVVTSAVIGWVVIEGLLWVFSHISVTWGGT